MRPHLEGRKEGKKEGREEGRQGGREEKTTQKTRRNFEDHLSPEDLVSTLNNT
jgi:predicted transposase YdaD